MPSREVRRVAPRSVARPQAAPERARRSGHAATRGHQPPGRRLPDGLRSRMERGFGVDLSAVRVHEGAGAGALGALAYTRGTDIHFGPGEYRPDTPYGQALLGHELAHVVQQRSGRVPPGVDADPRLEREADDAGLRAARGEPVRLPDAPAAGTAAAEGPAPVQRKTPKWLKKILRRAGVMAPAPVPATPLDDFVNAFDQARFYHGSEPANLPSISQHGLLTQADREATLGADVKGMTARRYADYGGDEKKGVYLGNREFMETEFHENATTPIPPDLLRIFLPSDRTGIADAGSAGRNDLQLDPHYGGALISTSSIPAGQTLHGDMADILDDYEAGHGPTVARMGTILQAVGTHYPGGAPTQAVMAQLLRQAVQQRRLSNRPLDIRGRG